jgi:hypothetical protein
VIPAPTIKYDASYGSIRTVKRVKFEEIEEDDPIELSRFEEFKQQNPKAIEEVDRMTEKQSMDPEQITERGVDSAELAPAVEDEMSEEQRRAAAEEKANHDEEIEKATRQWAEMMKEAAQVQQNAM